MSKIDLKNVTLSIRGKGGVDEELEIIFGEGNLQFSEKRNLNYDLDRGLLGGVSKGDEAPMEVSFEGEFDYWMSSSNVVSIRDALLNKAKADGSDWQSTWHYGSVAQGTAEDDDTILLTGYPSSCDPPSIDLVLENIPACAGSLTTPSEEICFPFFRAESVDVDIRNGTISVSGKCNFTHPVSYRADTL